MIQIPVEVSSGVASFTLSVRAESIQRAIGLVERSCPDAEEIKVVFPVPPEAFFVGDIGLESVLYAKDSTALHPEPAPVGASSSLEAP